MYIYLARLYYIYNVRLLIQFCYKNVQISTAIRLSALYLSNLLINIFFIFSFSMP